MKIPKKLLSYGFLLALTASLANTASAGTYDTINLPSVIPTAYQDAQVSLGQTKKAASDTSNGVANTLAAQKDESDASKNLEDNIKTLMAEGNFGSTGLFFGPTSGTSKKDQYGTLTDRANSDKTNMVNFGLTSGQTEKVHAYHAFGLAVTRLKDGARKTDPGTIGLEDTLNQMESLGKAFATFGIRIVKMFNPLPVVSAFYDSSYLNQSAYAGNGKNQGNELIKLINNNPSISKAIRIFGDPVTVGSVSVSMAFMITGVLVFLSLGYAAFLSIWNGQSSLILIRKALLKLVIASIGVPLVAMGGSRAMEWMDDMLVAKQITPQQAILRENLHIYNWYKNASFALPVGKSLTVKDGRFQLDEEIVYEINRLSSVNSTSAGGSALAEDDKTISKNITQAAFTNKNTSLVSFAPSYSASNGGFFSFMSGSKGEQWNTAEIFKYADALGENKKYEENKLADNPYVKNVGLESARGTNDLSYTYTQKSAGYGISPLASFNLMATDFNESGFVVSTNTGTITTPTIAASVVKFADSTSGTLRVPGIVKFAVMFTLVTTGIKTIMSIMSAGFGGVFKGGAGTALGSAAGMGTLVGGVVALTLGLFGLSVIMTVALGMLDVMYMLISKMIFSADMMKALDEGADAALGILRALPGVGLVLNGILKGFGALALGIMAILMIPQIIRTPIVAYGEFMAGIPAHISERFLHWERQFTGDYRSGGHSLFGAGSAGSGGGGSSGSSAMKDMKAEEKKKRDARWSAIKTGSAMVGAAGLAMIGSKLAFGGDPDDPDKPDDPNGDGPNDDGPNDPPGGGGGGPDGPPNDPPNNDDPPNDPPNNDDPPNNNPPGGGGDDDPPTDPPIENPTGEDEKPEGSAETPSETTSNDVPKLTDPPTEGVDKEQSMDESDKEQSTGEQGKEQSTDESGKGETTPQEVSKDNSLNKGDTTETQTPEKSGDESQSVNTGENERQHETSEKTPTEPPSASEEKSGSIANEETTQNGDNVSNVSDTKVEGGNQIDDTKIDEKSSLDEKVHDDNKSESKADMNVGGSINPVTVNSSDKATKSPISGGTNGKSGGTTGDGITTSKSGTSGSGQTGGKSGTGGTTSGPQTSGTPKGFGNKPGGKSGGSSKSSKSPISSGNMKRAFGKGLMMLGGADPSRPVDKGIAASLAKAGAAHAFGGLTGMQKHTQRFAQNAIDLRNEDAIRNGDRVRSNLSTIGETRSEAQRRMESSLNVEQQRQDMQEKQQRQRELIERQKAIEAQLKQMGRRESSNRSNNHGPNDR